MRIGSTMVVVVGVLLGVLAGEARAQEMSREEIVKGAIKRARRGVATGVTVGVSGAWALGEEETAFDSPISFGLGFRKFDIKVLPDVSAIRAKAEARVKEKVKERAKQYMREGKPPPSEEEMRAIGLQILAEVTAEIFAELNVKPKLIEDQSLAIDLEGLYLPKSETGEIRLTAGYGISKVTIGPNLALVFADEFGLTLGGEMALRLLPGGGPRPPVIDIFVRGDFGVVGPDTQVVTVGTRILLDII